MDIKGLSEFNEAQYYTNMMQRRTAFILLIVILACGTLLRVYELPARSLWFDEAITWKLIQFPYADVIARTIADVHPPLYYFFVKVWALVFGGSALSLRAFSVLGGVLAIWASYLFTRTATRSRTAAVIVAALAAASVWQIRYSQEARMYTQGTTLLLLASWAVLKATRSANSQDPTGKVIGWWILYGILAAASAYTHYFTFFTLLSHAVYVAWEIIRQTKWRLGEVFNLRLMWTAVLGAVTAIGLYLPWIRPFIHQYQQVQQSYWVPEVTRWSVAETFYRVLFYQDYIPHTNALEVAKLLLPVVIICVAWIVLFFLCRRPSEQYAATTPYLLKKEAENKKQKLFSCDGMQLIVLTGVIPIITVIALSLGTQSLYNDRFLTFTQIFVLIAVGTLIARLPGAFLKTGITVALVALSTWNFYWYWDQMDVTGRAGARGAVQYVAEHRSPNDPILATSAFIFFSAEHYGEQQFHTTPVYLLQEGELLHFTGGPFVTDDDLITLPELEQQKPQAVWTMTTNAFGSQPHELNANWRKVEEKTFPEISPYHSDIILRKYQLR